MSRNGSTAVGCFDDRGRLRQSVEALRRAGFRNGQIGVATHLWGDEAGGSDVTETKTNMEEWAVNGAVLGAILGGLAGAVAVGVIPGLGPMLAGGILEAIAGGAVSGGIGGGVLGGLLGLSVPEREERDYEEELRAGHGIVTVKAGARYQEAEEILHRYGAHDIHGPGIREREAEQPLSEEDRAA